LSGRSFGCSWACFYVLIAVNAPTLRAQTDPSRNGEGKEKSDGRGQGRTRPVSLRLPVKSPLSRSSRPSQTVEDRKKVEAVIHVLRGWALRMHRRFSAAIRPVGGSASS